MARRSDANEGELLGRVPGWVVALAGIAWLFAPAPPAPAQADPEGSTGLRLQFPNNPVSDLLGVYELLTGKAVVKDSQIFDGTNISLVTANEVTTGEAVRLIESALQSNGYVIIPEPDGTAVRVLSDDASLAEISESLDVKSDPSELPPGRQLVSYFLRLAHLDPVEASIVFSGHLGLNEYGRLTPVSNPPGLLVTENSAMVRQILKLKDVLDVSQDLSVLTTRFYQLEHADASVLAEVLTSTFETRARIPPVTSETIGDRRSLEPQRGDQTVQPQVVADDRLNRLMVVARADDHVVVERVVAEFDQPTELREPYERPLKYVFVDEVLPVLVDVLQDTGTGVSRLADGETIRTRLPPQASTQAAALTGRVRQGVQRREDEASQVGGRQDILIAPTDNTAPISVQVGKTRLIADLQANAIFGIGPAADLAKIDQVLDRLDRRPPQVYLATVIGQLTLGDGIEFGVDYLARLRETGDGAYAGSLFTNLEFLDRVGDITAPPGASPPISPLTGLLFYGKIQDDLEILVRALESTDRFKVLSRPSVFASNNKKAVIASGSRIPIPTSTITDLSNPDSVRTNIDFEDVVLKLEVVPLINSNQEVSLTIAQVNDTVVGQQKVAEDLIPVIGTEQLTTTVTIPNRSTIVLGGLISETEEELTEGLPLVSRIPYLGNAFKSTRKKRSRKELLVFIQPVVVESDADIAAASYHEDLRTKIGAEAYQAFPPAPEPADAPPATPATLAPPPVQPTAPAPEAYSPDSGRARRAAPWRRSRD
jgi:type II secretion system protein D